MLYNLEDEYINVQLCPSDYVGNPRITITIHKTKEDKLNTNLLDELRLIIRKLNRDNIK